MDTITIKADTTEGNWGVFTVPAAWSIPEIVAAIDADLVLWGEPGTVNHITTDLAGVEDVQPQILK